MFKVCLFLHVIFFELFTFQSYQLVNIKSNHLYNFQYHKSTSKWNKNFQPPIIQIKSNNNDNNNWWESTEDEVIIKSAAEIYYDSNGQSLFDSLYNINDNSMNKDSDISLLTIRDISESYQFSIPFLADFVLQIGCRPPIDIDIKIGDMLAGEQIYTLLEALNTLDPFESNIDYDSLTASDLAEELGISYSTIVQICERERFNLPFGMHSVLHKAVVDKIVTVHSYDEYQLEDDSNVIDVEME